MKILLVPDKFKGSVSAEGVINALKRGIARAHPKVDFHSVLASDGGDGFLNSISRNIACERVVMETVDPLGRQIQSTYLLDRGENKAYIELAKASGLELLSEVEKSATETSTYGTGLEIKDAIEKGATKIYIGLGGSATNDAGMGIASALGYRFLDSDNNELLPIGRHLSLVKRTDRQNVDFPSHLSVFAINDVDNPLYGENGAAYTYAKQKGANSAQINELDHGLEHFSEIVRAQIGIDAASLSGSGAAGGTAYGLKVFFNASYVSGIDFILELNKVETLLKENKFDYIITGEGKFDKQTLNGKLIKGVGNLGKLHNISVLAVCGQLDVDEKEIRSMGIEAALEVKNTEKSLEYNMQHGAELVEKRIFEYFTSMKS